MIVIGAGRIGTALHERAAARGVDCTLVTRTEGWDALQSRPGTPILLAVRNDDLDTVVGRIPAHRRHDLVFIQNGMIRGWLQTHSLARCTRGLLYLAVPRVGAPIAPGGVNPFCGAHAVEMVGRFVDLGLEAEAVDWARFSAWELEKLIWLCAFGVLCEHLDLTVGEVCAQHRAELRSLVTELSRVGRAALGVDMPLGWLVDRLCRYSASVASWRASVKAWPWRNGWFVEAARRYGVPTPLHDELLRHIGRWGGEE